MVKVPIPSKSWKVNAASVADGHLDSLTLNSPPEDHREVSVHEENLKQGVETAT